jgi:hypothetical protein
MKFTAVKDPIPFLIIDNVFCKEEQVKIYKEIDFLSIKLLEPVKTGSAKSKSETLKSNKGIFLDEFYAGDRIKSDILKINRKLFSSEIKKELKLCHYAYDLLDLTNHDTTLLSYYGDNDSYFRHKDESVISMVTWFYKKPKNFTGGELIFTDFNLNINVENNRTVIFFGSYVHEVTKVILKDTTVPYSGRFTLSNFCNIA